MGDFDGPEYMRSDIAYAIWKAPIKGVRKLLPEEREWLSRHIIEHLQLCNWQFLRGEPLKPHSTPESWGKQR